MYRTLSIGLATHSNFCITLQFLLLHMNGENRTFVTGEALHGSHGQSYQGPREATTIGR